MRSSAQGRAGVSGASELSPGRARSLVRTLLSEYDTLWALFILCFVSALLSDRFLTLKNIYNILLQASAVGTAAAGVTFVIITGGIDLSIGSVFALTGIVLARYEDYPPAAVIAGVLLLGAFWGLVNGTLVSRFRMPSFVTTFGTANVIAACAYILCGGLPLHITSPVYRFLGSGKFLGLIPMPIIIYAAALLLCNLILSRTVLGTYVYAMGGNQQASYLSGINVPVFRNLVWVFEGAVVALGGIIYAVRLYNADPGIGPGITLDAIASVVIGGTPFEGGYGSIFRTLVGTLIIGVLNNICNILNISPFLQISIKGAVIILAVLITKRRVT
ncbi:MAG: ABC transporter permease [Acetobacteraceae bacterium]|nr:ABC transporter permease [Acetobacteraceae bacterium]